MSIEELCRSQSRRFLHLQWWSLISEILIEVGSAVSQGVALAIAYRSPQTFFEVIADNIIVNKKGNFAAAKDLVCFYAEGKIRCLTTDAVAIPFQQAKTVRKVMGMIELYGPFLADFE